MRDEKAIQQRSYLIWEREGRPHGLNVEHWLQAKAELLAERQAKAKAARGGSLAKGDAPPAKAAGATKSAKRPPVTRKSPAPRDA